MRTLRRWLTARASRAALAAAPSLRAGHVRKLGRLAALCGPHLPVFGRIVAENMRSAGVYSRGCFRDYFVRAADHLAGALHIFRFAGQGVAQAGRMNPVLEAIVRDRIRIDDSVARLRASAAGGRGVVIMGAHAANFMLGLARLNLETPITVYLRHSKDERRQAAKRLWCEATGLSFIAEPANAADPTSRAARMAEALREGRALVVTPDLPQKRDHGAAVRLLDRTVWLPNGAAALALLTESPLLTLTARAEGDANCIVLHGPYQGVETARGRGWRQREMAARLQWFADRLGEFLVNDPAVWFLWGDGRWTRVFHGDARFVDQGTPPTSAASATLARGVD